MSSTQPKSVIRRTLPWRWLIRAVPSGAPLSQSVPLTMQGRIRI